MRTFAFILALWPLVSLAQFDNPVIVGSLTSAQTAVGYKTPDQIGSLLAWWKADSLTANNGDAITSWTDSSGNSHTATANAGLQEPAYYTNTAALNSKPALVFDGITNSYSIASFTHSSTNYTVFCVFYTTGTSKNNEYFMDIQTGRLIIHRVSPNAVSLYGFYQSADENSAANSTAANKAYVITWSLSDPTATIYTNGISAGTATYSKTAIGGTVRLGSRYLGGSSTSTIRAMIAEYGIYGTIIADSDRQSLESGLGQKYGIPVTH